MHCRDLTEGEFETIAAQLSLAKTLGDEIELITGRHEDHGTVMLIRDATRCMILVDEPALLDGILADRAESAGGAALARAMRAGR